MARKFIEFLFGISSPEWRERDMEYLLDLGVMDCVADTQHTEVAIGKSELGLTSIRLVDVRDDDLFTFAWVRRLASCGINNHMHDAKGLRMIANMDFAVRREKD